jgi:hypothetical protein
LGEDANVNVPQRCGRDQDREHYSEHGHCDQWPCVELRTLQGAEPNRARAGAQAQAQAQAQVDASSGTCGIRRSSPQRLRWIAQMIDDERGTMGYWS